MGGYVEEVVDRRGCVAAHGFGAIVRGADRQWHIPVMRVVA